MSEQEKRMHEDTENFYERWLAGESLKRLAEDCHCPPGKMEAVLRGHAVKRQREFGLGIQALTEDRNRLLQATELLNARLIAATQGEEAVERWRKDYEESKAALAHKACAMSYRCIPRCVLNEYGLLEDVVPYDGEPWLRDAQPIA